MTIYTDPEKGMVVSAVTFQGEIIGRIQKLNGYDVVLEHPRLLVSDQSGQAGFVPGVSVAGKQEPEVMKFNRDLVLTVVPVDVEIEKQWVKYTSGLEIQ